MLNRPLKSSTLHGSVLLFTNHCWKMTVLFSLSPPPHPEASWSPAAEQAIQTLDQELQSEPRFQQVLRDTSQPRGSSARLACRVQGTFGWKLNQEQWLGPIRIEVNSGSKHIQ